MTEFKTLKSRVIPLPVDHIDTDRIIPARFLKATAKSGLGEALFADWRRNPNGSLRPDFPINQPEYRTAQILLAGANFGCGSSREHAPWAMVDFGLRAVVATSFADIFQNNALKNGLLPVCLDQHVHQALLSQLELDPQAELEIDLEREQVVLPDGTTASFTIDPFARRCLLDGVDELGYLLSRIEQIEAFEKMRSMDPCSGAWSEGQNGRRN